MADQGKLADWTYLKEVATGKVVQVAGAVPEQSGYSYLCSDMRPIDTLLGHGEPARIYMGGVTVSSKAIEIGEYVVVEPEDFVR
jgi:hypothetical protein